MEKFYGIPHFPALTPRQQQLMEGMFLHYQARNCYPTFAEMSKIMGKPSNYMPLVKTLLRKGYLVKSDRADRKYVFTDLALAWFADRGFTKDGTMEFNFEKGDR